MIKSVFKKIISTYPILMISPHVVEHYQNKPINKVRGSKKTNTSKKIAYQYYKPIIKIEINL